MDKIEALTLLLCSLAICFLAYHFNEAKKDLKEETHALQSQIAGLNSEINKLTNTNIDISKENSNLKKEVESFRFEIEQRLAPVTFFAYISSNLGTGSNIKHQIIVYDIVDLNIGNGYDKTTGRFIAPMSGTYLFHVVTGVYDRSYASVELILNGQVKDIGFPDSGEHVDRNHVTTATPLDLTKGDVVYVRIGEINGGNYIESNQYVRTSFSCVKIH